jgi:hypothetical protein
MSTVRGRSNIGSDGLLRIPLPGLGVNTEIEYTLEFRASAVAPAGNGQHQPVPIAGRKAGTDRLESLRRLAGSLDDPTFTRPSQGEFEKREPLE